MHPIFAEEARRNIYTGNVGTINIDRREENSRWRVGVGEVYDRKEMEKFGQGEEWHRYWQIKMHRHCVCVFYNNTGRRSKLRAVSYVPSPSQTVIVLANDKFKLDMGVLCDMRLNDELYERRKHIHSPWKVSSFKTGFRKEMWRTNRFLSTPHEFNQYWYGYSEVE